MLSLNNMIFNANRHVIQYVIIYLSSRLNILIQSNILIRSVTRTLDATRWHANFRFHRRSLFHACWPTNNQFRSLFRASFAPSPGAYAFTRLSRYFIRIITLCNGFLVHVIHEDSRCEWSGQTDRAVANAKRGGWHVKFDDDDAVFRCAIFWIVECALSEIDCSLFGASFHDINNNHSSAKHPSNYSHIWSPSSYLRVGHPAAGLHLVGIKAPEIELLLE